MLLGFLSQNCWFKPFSPKNREKSLIWAISSIPPPHKTPTQLALLFTPAGWSKHLKRGYVCPFKVRYASPTMTFVPRVIKCPPWKSRSTCQKVGATTTTHGFAFCLCFDSSRRQAEYFERDDLFDFESNRRFFFREKVERQHTNLHKMNAFWQTKKSINTGANVDLLLQNTEQRLLCLRWKFTCRFVCDVYSQLNVHMGLRWSFSGLAL